MALRDCLEWCFTHPTCAAGMRAPPTASLWDWMTQWVPRGSNTATCPTCRN